MNKKNIIIWLVLIILIGAFFIYRQNNLNNLNSVDNLWTETKNEVVCTDDYNPVCGDDNKTHSNECVATKIDNVQVQYKWQCKDLNNTETTSWEIITSTWENISTEVPDNSTSNIDNSSSWVVSASWMTSESWSIDWVKIQSYSNSNYNYGFSLPYNTYFSWYGAKWWANHTVWINAWTWANSFEENAVKVYFYKWKTISELENVASWLFEDKANGMIYMKVWDNSVIIEALPWNDNIVNIIKKSIYAN